MSHAPPSKQASKSAHAEHPPKSPMKAPGKRKKGKAHEPMPKQDETPAAPARDDDLAQDNPAPTKPGHGASSESDYLEDDRSE